MICEELNEMRLKEHEKDYPINTINLDVFSRRINAHIKYCKKCQPERLNPETSKEDAIV